MFDIIACVDQSYGLGKDGIIPWHWSSDLKYFKRMTTDKICIFGWNTWASLPDRAKERLRYKSYVFVNRQTDMFRPTGVAHIRKDGLKMLNKGMICGGAFMYEWALQNLDIGTIYLNRILNNYNCDRFFPKEYLNWYKCTYRNNCSAIDVNINKSFYAESLVYTRKDLL